MWTIFLRCLSSCPVKAGSVQEGGEGRKGAEQEELEGAGGATAATAAREGMGESLSAGLKQLTTGCSALFCLVVVSSAATKNGG